MSKKQKKKVLTIADIEAAIEEVYEKRMGQAGIAVGMYMNEMAAVLQGDTQGQVENVCAFLANLAASATNNMFVGLEDKKIFLKLVAQTSLELIETLDKMKNNKDEMHSNQSGLPSDMVEGGQPTAMGADDLGLGLDLGANDKKIIIPGQDD